MRKIEKGEFSFADAFHHELSEAVDDSPELKRGERKITRALKLFFRKHETPPCQPALDLRLLLADVGEEHLLRDPEFNEYLEFVERSHRGLTRYLEFATSCNSSLRAGSDNGGDRFNLRIDFALGPAITDPPEDFAEEEEEEEEGGESRRALLVRAFAMMALGTAVVVVLSDPMVRGIEAMGSLLGVSSFYISFFFSPLVSDAIEILVAYQYARKKTRRHITVALAQIQGSVVMNNTLCLGLFLALIAGHERLTWQYSAETMGILAVEVVVIWVSLGRTLQLWSAWAVLACHPLSVSLVLVL